MDSFIHEKDDQNPRAYSIISTSDQPIVFTNQAMNQMNQIIKQLNDLLLAIPICQNNFRDLTLEERSIINAIRRDESMSNLFAGILGFDYVIQYFFKAVQKIHQEVGVSFSQFAQGYTKIRQQINFVNEEMILMDKKFYDLEGRIKNLTYLQIHKQNLPKLDQNTENYLLLNQNRILKQNMKRLQQKYKHVLLQQKNNKEKDLRQSNLEHSGEDNYGFRRGSSNSYQPMRISVQILQRKLKQAEKQIAILKKKSQFDYMRLIQQLERQIEILRIQKNQNIKTINQLRNKINLNTKTLYASYGNIHIQQPSYQDRSNRNRITASRYTNINNILPNKKNTYFYQEYRTQRNGDNISGQSSRVRQKSVPLNLKAKAYQ